MKNKYDLNEGELTELTLLVEHGPIAYYQENEKIKYIELKNL